MNLELNPTLHQPVRTKIMAYLMSMGEVDFTTIKKVLALTDGHMSTHMKLLVEEGYVEVEKEFIKNKPKTTYRVSRLGKKEFQAYIETIKKLVSS